jgi:acyl-CoA thioester hydrolase
MNLISPTLADYPIRAIEKLRFADTDRNGHITNSVFAVCCQNARMELLCDPRRVPVPSNTQFVVARLLLEFRAEMHWPGTVEVGTRIDRIGRSSVTLAQALFVGDDCVATSQSVVVLIDATTRRPTPLPPQVVEALQPIVWVNGSGSVTAPHFRTHSGPELSMETARRRRNRTMPSQAMPPTASHDKSR